MTPPITLQQREKQLQSLLGTPEGREELQELANRYSAASGKVRPAATSPSPTFRSRSGNRA
jgi:hypothetical protein